jgi:hypothetical protein
MIRAATWLASFVKAKYQLAVRLCRPHRLGRLSLGIGSEALIAEDTFPFLTSWFARAPREGVAAGRRMCLQVLTSANFAYHATFFLK